MSLIPMGAPPLVFAPPPSVEFLQPMENTADQTVYSFTSQNLGAVHTKRRLFGLAAARRNADGTMTISQCGINSSNNGTVHVSASAPAGNPRIHFFIFSVPLPNNTVGTVNMTFDQTAADCRVHLYRAINLNDAAPHHTATDPTDPVSMSLNVPNLGIVLGGAYLNATGAVTPTGLTGDHDSVFDGTKRTACGSAFGLAAETGRTVSFDQGSLVAAAGACLSWR